MPVVAFVQATNLQELEGRPGLQVMMSFRMEDQMRSLNLEGIVSVTEDFMLGNIEVTLDEIGLGAEENELLLRAGAGGCWNAIFEHDRVAAGFLWRSLRSWMRGIGSTSVARLESKVEVALTCS
jgi:hypothetical protein